MNRRVDLVLIVDDEPDHVELVRRAFAEKSPRVCLVETSSLSGAKDLLAQNKLAPCAILVDWRLPDGDGLELLDLSLPFPIIMLTAYGSEGVAVEAMKRGALDYVVKSAGVLSDLPHIVERAVVQWRTEREHEAMAKALRESEERYALAVNGSNDGIWDWNLSTGSLVVSNRWRELFGYASDALPHSFDEWLSLVHPEDRAAMHAHLEVHLGGQSAHFEHEHRMRAADDQYHWVLTRGLAVRDQDGKPCRIAGSLTEISERKRIERQLLYDAFHDSLTGLYNRAIFIEHLERRIKSWQRHPHPSFAVLFLDLDRFKYVNDTLGHAAGDSFLVMMAARLRRSLREEDLIARVGGDEFAVLAEGAGNETAAKEAALRVHSQLRSPLLLEQETIYPGASIGIALMSPQFPRAEDILRSADQAMYLAKARGGDHVAFSDDISISSARWKLRVEHDLRRALAHAELRMAYQPVVSLDSGGIVNWEALLRWKRPGHGCLAATDFVPLAEDAGLIDELDLWTLREVTAQQRDWQARFGAPVPVSVNLSAGFFAQPGFADILEDTVRKVGAGARWLNVEITESFLIKRMEAVESEISRLERLQIGLWLDDFGIGYSSLGYLARLPLQMLKIDRSFVARMLSSPRDLSVVKAIHSIASSLEIPVVAEGIETAEQAEKLRQLGYQYGQGFYFSPPLIPEEAGGEMLPGRMLAPAARAGC
ncbi:MAG: EAL domain-containing protein [Acidobacteria bacterium]|nr:EAL domain-containing protein [Acidobacteriota bacterium]